MGINSTPTPISPLPKSRSQLNLHQTFSDPIRIASVELLVAKRSRFRLPKMPSKLSGPLYLIRTTSTDGAEGWAIAHERIRHFFPIFQELISPFFAGKDARDLEALIDQVYVTRSNYKLSGLALWCCVAWVELSILDMLGKIANQSVAGLFGGVQRQEIPVYLSSLRRDTTPEKEVNWVGKRLAETGAKAVKFKIGGRMSANADASPQRTEKLVSLARQTFGDETEIYVDANGSYDAATGIEVGKMLEAHNIGFFEEPCPFDDWAGMQKINQALKLPVAGGEQETSLYRFEWMMQHGIADILQPDLIYNGGFIRTSRLMQSAIASNIPVAIHNARLDVDSIYMLQFAACHPTQYQEYNAKPHTAPVWLSPTLTVKGGKLSVPTGRGFGFTIDPAVLRRAKPFRS